MGADGPRERSGRSAHRVIGQPYRKVDATAKVTGETLFADDLSFSRMLYCKMLRSPHAHARIVKVDTTKAAAFPGVCAVLTGNDLPLPFGILPVSQDEHALAPETVRFVGDPVAAVAATTEEIATEALELIEVGYEPLKEIGSIEDAMAARYDSLRDMVKSADFIEGPRAFAEKRPPKWQGK